MENPEQGNSTVNDGTSGNITDVGLKDIMAGMAESKPDVKPDVNGDKTEGTKKEGPAEELPAWTSQLPDELRSDVDVMKKLGKFNKIGDLAKSYNELESKLGRSIVKPGENASEEELKAFYSKLGRPESADGYSIKGEEAKAFRELAFNNNLTDVQAAKLYAELKTYGQNMQALQQKEMELKSEEADRTLKAEFGNMYTEKLKMLQRGIKTYAGENLGAKLKASGLLYDVDVVKMFILLGEQSQEAGSISKGIVEGKQYKSTAEGGQFTFKGL